MSVNHFGEEKKIIKFLIMFPVPKLRISNLTNPLQHWRLVITFDIKGPIPIEVAGHFVSSPRGFVQSPTKVQRTPSESRSVSD